MATGVQFTTPAGIAGAPVDPGLAFRRFFPARFEDGAGGIIVTDWAAARFSNLATSLLTPHPKSADPASTASIIKAVFPSIFHLSGLSGFNGSLQ
jgi:hypothetical protein